MLCKLYRGIWKSKRNSKFLIKDHSERENETVESPSSKISFSYESWGPGDIHQRNLRSIQCPLCLCGSSVIKEP